MWRIASAHLNNDHAKKQQVGRQTLCDYFGLTLRDRVDVITGDWNEAYRYIGEALTHAVKLHERQTGESLQWILTPSTGEIRSIIVNWPTHTMSSFKGPMEHLEMTIKPIDRWSQYSASDFGLRERDSDSHTPYLYLLRKAAAVGRRADRHVRSEAGKQKDAEKRKQRKRENRAKK